MIKQYGADAVRWFILSDSPPEKDVQWSDSGVISANKFLQKIWNLNYLISKRKDVSNESSVEKKFNQEINLFIKKIDNAIKNFRFNVAVALFYEIYNYLKDFLDAKVSSKVLKNNIIKIMKVMMPFTPHLAYECLELFKCESVNDWPKIDERNLIEKINIAVQINGKTRDVISIKKDLVQKDVENIFLKESKANKYVNNKKIVKTIFVKNKILNYIVSDK